MQDESVAAEIFDRDHVVMIFGSGIPRDLFNVCPNLVSGNFHQRLSHPLIGPHDSSPDGFGNLVDEEALALGSTISHLRVRGSEESRIVHVRHHPEAMLVAVDDASRESPDGVGVVAVGEQGHIIHRHREFDGGEFLPDSGGAGNGTIDLREERECASTIAIVSENTFRLQNPQLVFVDQTPECCVVAPGYRDVFGGDGERTVIAVGDGAVDFIVEVGESDVALGLCQGVIVSVCGGIEGPGTVGMWLRDMRIGLRERYSDGPLQRLVSSMPEPSVLGDENGSQQEAEKSPNGRDHDSGDMV